MFKALFLLLPLSLFASQTHEIHINVCDSKAEITKKLGIKEFKSRDVYYVDTNKMDLYKSGVVLRLRLKGKKADITAKLRPFNQDSLLPRWNSHPLIDCEIDHYGETNKSSCSFKTKTKSDALGNVSTNYLNLFSGEKTHFVHDHKLIELTDYKLNLYGPTKFLKYEDDMGWSYESLIVNDKEINEISIKTNDSEYLNKKKELLRYLKEKGLTTCKKSVSKTGAILSHLSANE